MLTVNEVQKCALEENDIISILNTDLEPFRAARDLASRLGEKMLSIGPLTALEKLCSEKIRDDSGIISLNTYLFLWHIHDLLQLPTQPRTVPCAYLQL